MESGHAHKSHLGLQDGRHRPQPITGLEIFKWTNHRAGFTVVHMSPQVGASSLQNPLLKITNHFPRIRTWVFTSIAIHSIKGRVLEEWAWVRAASARLQCARLVKGSKTAVICQVTQVLKIRSQLRGGLVILNSSNVRRETDDGRKLHVLWSFRRCVQNGSRGFTPE